MLYIKLMLRKKLTLNTKFGYADDIAILRTGLTTLYTAITLINDVKNVLN